MWGPYPFLHNYLSVQCTFTVLAATLLGQWSKQMMTYWHLARVTLLYKIVRMNFVLAGHTKFSVDQFIISVHVADVYTQKVVFQPCSLSVSYRYTYEIWLEEILKECSWTFDAESREVTCHIYQFWWHAAITYIVGGICFSGQYKIFFLNFVMVD